jgi:YbgC/YbaW family acyl-CoA thioester hydrolase
MRPTTAESKTKVRFNDCDPFNHLNNSRYIDYLIAAREDHLLEVYGFDLYRHVQQTGIGWVVGEHRIAYVRPAVLMETLVIRSTVIEWQDAAIWVEMQMWNEDKTVLKCLLWTCFVHVNMKTGRKEGHPADLQEQFSGLVAPGIKENGFEARVAALRTA